MIFCRISFTAENSTQKIESNLGRKDYDRGRRANVTAYTISEFNAICENYSTNIEIGAFKYYDEFVNEFEIDITLSKNYNFIFG